MNKYNLCETENKLVTIIQVIQGQRGHVMEAIVLLHVNCIIQFILNIITEKLCTSYPGQIVFENY